MVNKDEYKNECVTEILAPVFWHSFAKLCTKNHENPSVFVKLQRTKSVTLFYVDKVMHIMISFGKIHFPLLRSCTIGPGPSLAIFGLKILLSSLSQVGIVI